ncbi:MAG: hypothetical protein RLZZ306_1186, partial [Bacteroidota bacterium]
MKKTLLLALAMGLLLTACKKDEPEPVQDNEFISTMRLTFTEGTNKLVYSIKDLDGDGGKAPVADVIKLLPNKTYTVTTEFLDETKTPIVNLTSEIEKESAEHLVVFESPASLLTVTRTDKDSRGFEIGLKASARTVAAANGSIKVTLRHQPEVGGMPTKN